MRNFTFFFLSLFFSVVPALLSLNLLSGQSAANIIFPVPLTDELAFRIDITSSGDIFIAGKVPTLTSEECYISKHDSSGNFLWSKMIGGINYDYFKKSFVNNNNVICGGNTSSFGQSQNFYLVKFNQSGDTLWSKILGGSYYDKLMDIISNGTDLLLTGYSNSFGSASNNDILLINTDSSGFPLWAKSIEAPGEDIPHVIKKSPDDGFIIAGSTTSFGSGMKDGFVLKADNMGNFNWLKCFGGTDDEEILDLTIEDKNLYITGYTKSLSGIQDLWIFKLDSIGNILWNKSVDFGLNEKGNKIFFGNNSVFICGYMQSITGSADDIFVLKTDENGNNISVKQFQLSGQQYGNFIGEVNEKIFASGMYTDSVKMKIFEINDTVLSCSSATIDFDSMAVAFAITDTFFVINSIPVDSISMNSGGDFADYGNPYVNADICFLPEDTNTTGGFQVSASDQSVKGFQIFPNPSNGKFIVKLQDTKYNASSISIMDITGEIIFHSPAPHAPYCFNLLPGIYFLHISDGNHRCSEKIVIQDF